MNFRKKLLIKLNAITWFYLYLFIPALGMYSQVSRNIFIENFTNTRCSACANRMPGFYNNIKNVPQVIQIAYHPSAPYASCMLSQHNVLENDQRTNFYNLYGATPKVIVNGRDVSSMDLSNPSIYQSELNKTSIIDIQIKQELILDSIKSIIVFKKVTSSIIQSFLCYAVLNEDTIFYAAPNGEKFHFNVFRKNILNQAIQLNAENDSIVFELKTKKHPNWELGRIKTVAWITENGSKIPLQAQQSNVSKTLPPVILDSVHKKIVLSGGNSQKESLIESWFLQKDKPYTMTIEDLNIPNGWSIDSIWDSEKKSMYNSVFLSNFRAIGNPQKDLIGVQLNHNKIEGYGSAWIAVYPNDSPQIITKRKYSLQSYRAASIQPNIGPKKWRIDAKMIFLEDFNLSQSIELYNILGKNIPIIVEDATINLLSLDEGIYVLEWDQDKFKIYLK